MPEIPFRQWRAENQNTNYPFSDAATLTNGTQAILQGTLIDAMLYPIGGDARMFISGATITYNQVTLVVGTQANAKLCSTTFKLLDSPNEVQLLDANNRPAGVLISEAGALGFFATWGVGTFTFSADQTEFTATVCAPQPEIGVRGIALPDGTVLTGEVWLVGENGVVLRHESVHPDADERLQIIRVDLVGDPLFLRRLCTPTSLFQTPRFLKTLTFKDGLQSIKLGPDAYGDVKLTVNNDFASDTVLRVTPTQNGNQISVVGSTIEG